MFDYIKGTIHQNAPTKVVVEANGIGYLIYISLSTFSKLPHVGKEILLYVSFIVREDAHKLYGFITLEERNAFNSLLDVTGVGPKIALSILGHMQMQDLQNAIKEQNVHQMTQIPGIGKKIAERLILELKDKWKLPVHLADRPNFDASDQNMVTDAIAALVHLGYPSKDAEKTVNKIFTQSEKKLDLSNLITLSLKAKK